MRVDYPIAIDNDYAIWRAFDNHYWPALYFVDAEGRIRHHQFGEGDYERDRAVIQQLLAEAGGRDCRAVSSRSTPGHRGGRPTGNTSLARDLPRARTWRAGSRSRPSATPSSEPSPQPVGARRRVDDTPGRGRPRRGRGRHRVPLPRPRPQSRAPAATRGRDAVPGPDRRRPAGHRPRSRLRRGGERRRLGAAPVPADPPARPERRAHVRDHLRGAGSRRRTSSPSGNE